MEVNPEDDDIINPLPVVPAAPQVQREMRQLESWEPVTVYEGRTCGQARELLEIAFVSAVTLGINEPKMFAEAMASPNCEKWLEAIKLDTQHAGLLIEPYDFTDMSDFQAFCDSDYSGDREKCLSITGYIIYLMGVAIAWKA